MPPLPSSSSSVTVWRYMYSLRSASVSVSRCAASFARFAGGSCADRKGAKITDARMSAMHNSPGGFRAALAGGWAALGAAGILYVRAKGIPILAALPVIAAFLIAYPFYLVTGFRAIRERLAGPRLKWFLLAAVVLPYLICCCGAIEFHWYHAVRVAALALTMSLWYVVLPGGTGLRACQAHSTDREDTNDRP